MTEKPVESEEKVNKNVYYFKDSINKESTQDLIDSLSELEGNIDLFFGTNGGYTSAMSVLLHYLNLNKNRIVVYLIDRVCSAGTDILTRFEGKIVISYELDYLLFHVADREINHSLKTNPSDKILAKQDKKDNKKQLKKYIKLGFSKKDIKHYKQGKDVVWYKKDFKRLNINK